MDLFTLSEYTINKIFFSIQSKNKSVQFNNFNNL